MLLGAYSWHVLLGYKYQRLWNKQKFHLILQEMVISFDKPYKNLQVLSLEDGPVRSIWKDVGVPVIITNTNGDTKISVDWLKYVSFYYVLIIA